ncbi:hypothetical protein [Pseudothioclava arenosa]|uniref:Uncharacterized protein n=1 Tax=Pseudothioclava arenosa TaxID=1795308 RepID=A0A2A4CRR1_9RHOB|nr:hypothetical protein [Pseudothioclava arenosa]PCD77285.1 hypothetical protein CLN94_05905 [Pseudothioclava arenosa]
MELIVGNKRVVPEALHRIAGGVEVELAGEALTSLLDATFGGGGSIELWGEHGPEALDVADIRMVGRATTVTLHARKALALH